MPRKPVQEAPTIETERLILRGYRLEDFVADADASRDAFCATAVQSDLERAEVREARGVYRLRRPPAYERVCQTPG